MKTISKLGLKIFLIAGVVLFIMACDESALAPSADEYLSVEANEVYLDRYAQGVLNLQSKTDSITIKDLSANRGQCAIGMRPEFEFAHAFTGAIGALGFSPTNNLSTKKNLPKTLKFGQSASFALRCDINALIEVTLNTDKGDFTFKFK